MLQNLCCPLIAHVTFNDAVVLAVEEYKRQLETLSWSQALLFSIFPVQNPFLFLAKEKWQGAEKRRCVCPAEDGSRLRSFRTTVSYQGRREEVKATYGPPCVVEKWVGCIFF